MIARNQAGVNGVALPRQFRGRCWVGGREVWWTGRVAIGLRWQPPAPQPGAGMLRLQQALLPGSAR